MKTKLNAAFLVVKPIINSILGDKLFNLPTHLGKYFLMSNFNLKYYNSFVMFGVTPTFVGPSPAERQNLVDRIKNSLPPAVKRTIEVPSFNQN